jgi:hypothetical protein
LRVPRAIQGQPRANVVRGARAVERCGPRSVVERLRALRRKREDRHGGRERLHPFAEHEQLVAGFTADVHRREGSNRLRSQGKRAAFDER